MRRTKQIREALKNRYEMLCDYYNSDNIFGIFLYGSQNYLLDNKDSDIDTKAIIIPSFHDICFNKKPISTTYTLDNNEKIDCKDIRVMFQQFRKQNINFIEILFTNHFIINPKYEEFWGRLCYSREDIARYNEHRVVKGIKGMALEKLNALQHSYPSKVEILNKYGYDPKQLHHIFRFRFFLENYISGKSYEDCLVLPNLQRDFLIRVKSGTIPVKEAVPSAQSNCKLICDMADEYREKNLDQGSPAVDNLLDSVLENTLKTSLLREFSY